MKRSGRVVISVLLLLILLATSVAQPGLPVAYGAGPVSITRITPANGSATGGFPVVIEGNNFDTDPTVSVQVGFVNLPATVVGTPTPTKITAILPDITQPVDYMETSDQKSVLVVVDNEGTVPPSSDSIQFTYHADPRIESYKLNTDVRFTRDSQGNIIDRTTEYQLILEGQRLNQPIALLRLGGVTIPPADIRGSDYSYLQFRIPSGFQVGDDKDVYLETQYGGVVTFNPVHLLPTPDITNISRTQVIVGSELEIFGRDYEVGTEIDIAGGLTDITGIGTGVGQMNAGGTWMKIAVPQPLDMTSGKKDLKVILPGGQQMVTLKSEIEILPTPGALEIFSVSPNSGTTAGGTVVQVTGKGFQSNLEVWFGSNRATNVTMVDPPPAAPPGTTVLQVTTPVGPPVGGPVNVEVRDPVFPEINAVLTNGFTYTLVSEALYVGTINPDEGRESGGLPVTVRGRNFIRFRTADPEPPGHNKYLNGDPIRLTDLPGLSFSSPAIETVEEHTIDDPYNPGTPIDVNINRTLTCTIGGQHATLTGISKQPDGTWVLSMITPSVTLIPRAPQSVEVVVATTEEVCYRGGIHNGEVIPVLNRQEQEKAQNQFTYNLVPSAPEIKKDQVTNIPKIDPAMGSTAGGTTVTIEGWDFQSNVEIYFGSQTLACKGTVQDIEYLGLDPIKNKIITNVTVTTPPGTARGPVDVIVLNPTDGGICTETDAFEYISNPTITSVVPAVSPITGGTLVTVTGTDFLFDAVVQVGTVIIPSDQVQVWSSTGTLLDDDGDPPGVKVKFTVPPLPGGETVGSRDIIITNTDTGSVTQADAITYLEPAPGTQPIIATITPTEGPSTGGTDFTITGSNFGGTILVTFDGETATEVKSGKGGTEITGKTPPGYTIGTAITVQVVNLTTGGLGSKDNAFTYHIITSSPGITSFTPNHGTTGTLVHIVGSDFVRGGTGDPPAPSSSVYFGDTVLSTVYNDPDGITIGDPDFCGIYVVSDTLIQVRVPDLVNPGDYTVRVVNPDTATAVASGTFKFQLPASQPEIIDLDGDGSAIEPDRGSHTGGAVVLMEGLDFRSGCQVFLGQYAASVLSLESAGKDPDTGKWRTVLAFRVPAIPLADVGVKDVTLINADGGTAVVQDGFEFIVSPSSPVITSVTPNRGSGAGGYDIEIFGQDFRWLDADPDVFPEVYIGTNLAEVLGFTDDINGQTITVLAPASSSSGPKPVVVVNPDGGTYTLNNGFTYDQAKLSATRLIPGQADKAGDTVIELLGSGFVKPSTRTVGGVTINVPGTRVFMQTDISGTMQEEELTGQVTIDNTACDRVTVLTGTALRLITLPQSTVGSRTIRLLNPDGGQATIPVTIISPIVLPRITSIDPAEGTLAGGTLATITGSNFRPQAQVYIETKQAEIVSRKDDGTEIVIRTPAGTEADLGRKLDVIVVNPEDGASDALIEAWEYYQPQSQPVITRVEPNKGPTAGGTLVTITGDNFRFTDDGNDDNDAKVYFGTLEAGEITVVSYTTITCITPAHEEGACDVVVRNPGPDFGEATLKNGFTYEGGEVPEIPTGFTARLVAGRCIELTWQPSPGEVEATYEIYASEDGDHDNLMFIGSTDQTRYLINKVKEDTDYYFLLYAAGAGGASELVEADPYPLWVNELDRLVDYDEEEDEDEDEDERRPSTVDLQRDLLNITVGELPKNEYLQDYLDLTDKLYNQVNQVRVNIPYSLIYPGGRKLTLKTHLGDLDFYLNALYTTEVRQARDSSGWASGAGDNGGVYGRLILRTIRPDEVERATVKLGTDYQVVGGLEVLGEAQAGSRSHPMDGLFNQPIALTINARPRQWSAGEPGGIYYYDSPTRSWVRISGSTNPVYRVGSTSIMRPGRYALIIRR